jgi:hypothetical protein
MDRGQSGTRERLIHPLPHRTSAGRQVQLQTAEDACSSPVGCSQGERCLLWTGGILGRHLAGHLVALRKGGADKGWQPCGECRREAFGPDVFDLRPYFERRPGERD